MADIKVTFRGVRGSHAMPGPTTIRYGGNTTCVEVQAGKEHIILDAGTGIISVGKELLKEHLSKKEPVKSTLLLTHMHHDHNEGLPFFQPMYIHSSRIYMFGPHPLEQNIGDVLFRSPYFPVELRELPALKFLQSVNLSDAIQFQNGVPHLLHTARSPVEFSEDEVVIRVQYAKSHPKDGVYFYRIEYKNKAVVFCTDTEGYAGGDARLVSFASECDLLIHDAMYTTQQYVEDAVPRQGFGHSTPEMAIEVARQARAKQLACTHHDPDHSDDRLDEMEAQAKQKYPQCFFAKEGMTIEL